MNYPEVGSSGISLGTFIQRRNYYRNQKTMYLTNDKNIVEIIYFLSFVTTENRLKKLTDTEV